MNLIKRWFTIPTPHIFSKAFVEFMACAMFHFVGSVSATPYANGLALIVLVYYTAKTSGAHLNPAVTLTFSILGYTNPIELVFYWIAQISGCALGALFIALLVPGQHIKESDMGCFTPAQDISYVRAFGWETLCTFNFMMPIFSVVWYTLHKAGYGNTGPIIIGLSLLVNALVAGPYTGAALNPARVLGSNIVFSCESLLYAPYYIAGELLAGVLVPIIIIPWYGICPDSWYFDLIDDKVLRYLREYQPTIKFDRDSSV